MVCPSSLFNWVCEEGHVLLGCEQCVLFGGVGIGVPEICPNVVGIAAIAVGIAILGRHVFVAFVALDSVDAR